MKALYTTLLAIALTGNLATAQPDQNINITSLAWSPDGKQLIFSAIAVKPDWSDFNPANWRIFLYDMKNGDLKKVAAGANNGAISPDGCRIAYQQTENGNQDIFLENLCTGQRKRLTDDPARESVPTFSPDGKQLAFCSDRNGGLEVFTLDLEHPDIPPVQVTHGAPHRSYNPEWSPDGARLVYYLEKGDGRDQIWVTDLAGKSPRNITSDTLHSYYPSWTPAGNLLFTSTDEHIFTMKPDRTGRKPTGIKSFFARVSPQKKRIAYIRREDRSIVIARFPGLKPVRRIRPEDLNGKGFW